MNHDYSLIRLFPRHEEQLIGHLCELPDDDMYLRFGYNISGSQLMAYVNKSLSSINTPDSCDFWFGIMDIGDKLVGTIHIAIRDSSAEFAFSTHIDYRGQKLGQLLFARGYQLVTEYKIEKIYLSCLSQNKAMRHIAKKFGMSVMTYGTDAEASVNIQYPVPLSRINEVKMCCIDKSICLKGAQ